MRVEVGMRGLPQDRSAALLNAFEQQFRLKDGNAYLHWSGQFLTAKKAEAWNGTWRQLQNAKKRFAAAQNCRAVRIASQSPMPPARGE